MEFLIIHGPGEAGIDVLSSEQREEYQHLVPKVITVSEYFNIESITTKITILPDRNILYTIRNGICILMF